MTRLPMSEAQMQATLIEAARAFGPYRIAHFRPARTEHGWRTPVEGDAGFPDLVLALDAHVFAWELKAANGRLRHDQALWADELRGDDGLAVLEYDVVRPSTLDDAIAKLHDVAFARRRHST